MLIFLTFFSKIVQKIKYYIDLKNFYRKLRNIHRNYDYVLTERIYFWLNIDGL